MENKKILKYLSCSCFSLFAILQSKALISALINIHRVDFWIVLFIIGTVLIGISTWISQPVFMTVGGAFCALYFARFLLVYITDTYMASHPDYIINYILNIVFFSLLIVACNSRSSKGIKTMGIAAGLFSAVKFIIGIILSLSQNRAFDINLTGILSNLSLIVGPLFIGYVFIGARDKTVLKNISDSAPASSAENDAVARLVNLNSLLEAGIITQEEFEIKKKDILG